MSLVLYERRGRIAYITLNRPEAMNAGTITGGEFNPVMETFRQDEEAWVGVVTGAGDRAFSVGGDLKSGEGTDSTAQFWSAEAPTFFRDLEIWKPLIAAVNGYALGAGCMLALGCDIRLASENASFGLSETKLGWVVGLGGTQRITRLVPMGMALEMLFTGDRIDAQEAFRLGLVNRVVPQADLLPTATALAERIAANAPLAVRANKELAVRGLSLPLAEGLRLENSFARLVRSTEDAAEGRRAFLEKRLPQFKGR